MSYVVEGVTWELSGRLYQTVYPVGAGLYVYYAGMKYLFTGEYETLPRRIIHTGIIIHGNVYEYCDEGVKKTKATSSGDPGSVCTVDKLLNRKVLGRCGKTVGDFDRWVAGQMESRFAKENYCVANNQCVHFSIAAANFLGVGYPDEWDEMCKFTERNPTISKLANASTGSSTSNS